jgi:hypothetical protein
MPRGLGCLFICTLDEVRLLAEQMRIGYNHREPRYVIDLIPLPEFI